LKSKRAFSLIMAVCLMLGSAAALPQSAVVSGTSFSASAETVGNFEYTVDTEYSTVTITKYTGSAKSVTVPETINDVKVRKIGESVFKGNTNIESVEIKANLNYLTQNQFRDCTSLKSVTMPDSINWAYYSAFENCTSLESIKLPDELKLIPDSMFKGCTKLADISFPAKVESVAGNALENTKWLDDRRKENPLVVVSGILVDGKNYAKSSLTIPSNVKSISGTAFEGNVNLVSVTVPSTVTKLGGFAFEDCANLEKAILNCKVTRIDGVFSRCYKLKEVVLPDGLEIIQNYSFGHCESLKSIKLPSSIKELGFEAFNSCYALENINIPEGTQEIGYNAFRLCQALTSLDLPQSLKKIGDSTFYYSGLKELYLPAGVEKIGKDALNITSNGFKIICHKNSYAAQYAQDNNLKYELLAEHHRYAGNNRFETAVEISKAQFDKADTIILANGTTFPDALAGVPLAYAKKAPILLTQKDKIPEVTKGETLRLGAKNIILLGGEGAISENVEKELKGVFQNVTRVEGDNRYGTATAIANQLNKTPKELFFVYAGDFADALSVSTVAAVKQAPIIYLRKDGEFDKDTKAYLDSVKGKITNAYVIGGTGVISDDMMNKAAAQLGLTEGESVVRIEGSNRYETCNAVNNEFASMLTGSGICVAKGLDFPDALAGGVCAALNKSALVLVDNSVRDSQKTYLQNKKADAITIFGGVGAVPIELAKEIFLISK